MILGALRKHKNILGFMSYYQINKKEVHHNSYENIDVDKNRERERERERERAALTRMAGPGSIRLTVIIPRETPSAATQWGRKQSVVLYGQLKHAWVRV